MQDRDLRYIEYKLRDSAYRILLLEKRFARIEQDARRIQVASDNLVTYTGQVNGCNSLGFPLAEVTVKDHGTGATLDTLTCDSSGAFSGSLALSSNPQSIDFVVVPTGTFTARFASSTTFTRSLSPGTTTLSTMTVGPATSYLCTNGCGYPPSFIAPALYLTDSNGMQTLSLGTASSVLVIWVSSSMIGPPTVTRNPDDCTSDNDYLYNYRLSWAPPFAWTLEIDFWGVCCSGTLFYSSSGGGLRAQNFAFTTTATTSACDDYPTFSVPTSVSAGAFCGGAALNTPGGGGAIAVAP